MRFCRNWNRNWVGWGVLAWTLLLGSDALAEVFDKVVAKVNGDIITLSAVEERKSILVNQIRANGGKVELSDRELTREVLNTIIDEKLQVQEAKKLSLKVDNSNVEKALDDIKKENNISEKQLAKMLDQEGRSLKEYKDHIRDQILTSKVIRFEMGNRIKVSDREMFHYYKNHQKEFWTPGKFFVSHILFIVDPKSADKERRLKELKAREILRRLRAGQDFAELARKYSEDVSASSGGTIGEIKRGQLLPELENVIFKMREGEISDLVRSSYGYHIVKVDKVVPGKTQPFDEVKAQIRNFLAQKKKKTQYKEWMDDLKKEAYIEVSLFQEDDENPAVAQAGARETAFLPETSRSRERSRTPSSGNSDFLLEDWQEGFFQASGSTSVQKEPLGQDLKAMERKLSDLKKLRNDHKISEKEYQKRKQRLLDQL